MSSFRSSSRTTRSVGLNSLPGMWRTRITTAYHLGRGRGCGSPPAQLMLDRPERLRIGRGPELHPGLPVFKDEVGVANVSTGQLARQPPARAATTDDLRHV